MVIQLRAVMRQQVDFPVFWPLLVGMMRQHFASVQPSFTTAISTWMAFSEVQLLVVFTSSDENGPSEAQHLLSAVCNDGRHIADSKVIVNKSTFSVGIFECVTPFCNGNCGRTLEKNMNFVSYGAWSS